MYMVESHDGITMVVFPAHDSCRLADVKVRGCAATIMWSPGNRNSQCKGPGVEYDFWPVTRKGLIDWIVDSDNNRIASQYWLHSLLPAGQLYPMW